LKLYRILNSIDYFQNQVYEAFEAAGLVESIEKIVTRTALLALLARSLRAQPGLKVQLALPNYCRATSVSAAKEAEGCQLHK
jgi:hypothetical protein